MPLPLVIPLAALALSAAGTGYSFFDSKNKEKKAQKDLEAQQAAQMPLTTPSSLTEQLADARGRLGATDPAYTAQVQQAQQAAANQSSFAQRNASSGAQALAAGAQAQAQAQEILPGLAAQQTAYNQQNRGAFYNALQASTEDSRLKAADAAERNQAAQQFALGQIGAANANKSQAIGAGIATLGAALNYAGQVQSRPSTGIGNYQPDRMYGTPNLSPASSGMATAAITPQSVQPAQLPYGPATPSAVPLSPMQRLYLGNRIYPYMGY